jgi:hypothetical protein
MNTVIHARDQPAFPIPICADIPFTQTKSFLNLWR